MIDHVVRLPKGARSGFTLVELLVVIAIIGVLVGLLLPAVQASREVARRTSCGNNMIQLGVALHHFEFAHEHLPSGCINPTGPIRTEPVGQHVSWIVQTLPYFEQTVVYNAFDFNKSTYAKENRQVRRVSISTLNCPSHPDRPFFDSWDSEPENWEQEDAAEPETNPSSDMATEENTFYGNLYGPVADTHYAGCHHHLETPIAEDNHGLLYLNSRVRYREITDGSSQTLLLGEVVSMQRGLGWASGTRASLRNTQAIESATILRREIQDRHAQGTKRDPLYVGGFSSYHSTGINALFADGSLRFLSRHIEEGLLRNIGDRADGKLGPRL